MTAEGGRADRFYGGVRLIARFWVWFFFRRVDVQHVDRVPADGPALLCINHPNNMIDSLLVGAVLARKIHYLATAALFRHRLLARFLAACGAIPVYRRQDDPDKMDKNADAFAACFRTLERGGAVGIYPEGTTHTEARVQRIKTGAARIALEYEGRRAETGGAPLAVVPVGLTFDARKSFGGRVRIAFGERVAVTPYLPAYREDPVKAVDALTTSIQWAMQNEVLHVDRPDRTALVRAVEELYRSDIARELEAERGLSPRQIDPLRISQTIADAVAYFEAHDPERLERLWRDVEHYRAMLADYRVRDQAVRARLLGAPPRRLVRSWQAGVGLPVFLYGALVNFLPYALPRWLAHGTATKETNYATTRLLASIVAIPLFWGLEIWLVARWAGPGWALLFAASLPLSGLLAYRYLGGVGRLRSEIRFGVIAVTRHQAASRLLAARQAIVGQLDDAKREYLGATRGSSF